MFTKITSLLFLVLLTITSLTAQQLQTPPSGNNQKSIVTQYIGSIAHVTVIYNSPDVTAPNGDDRKGQIWGQVVPYGLAPNNFGTATEMPWRAGANENTIIKFSHDVTVQGKPLDAGAYGLHMIPRENAPWTIIFSKNTSSWGSYFYDESEDALRVEATPEKAPYHEWLSFEFIDRQPASATVALFWEELSVPFTIEVPNMNELYLAAMKEDLRGSAGFTWQNLVQAATFALQNNLDLEQALAWAETAATTSFVGQANFTTLATKAQVLMQMGRNDEAMATMQQAIEHPTASALQIHSYGRQLLSMGKKAEALKVFEYNYDKFDGAWPTAVGMARGLSAVGEYAKALKHAETAVKQAPDQLNKDAMAQAVEKLKKKEDIN
jgi:tetratricopeptide (TPR) repeat protein